MSTEYSEEQEHIRSLQQELKQAKREYATKVHQEYIDQVNYYNRERAHREKIS